MTIRLLCALGVGFLLLMGLPVQAQTGAWVPTSHAPPIVSAEVAFPPPLVDSAPALPYVPPEPWVPSPPLLCRPPCEEGVISCAPVCVDAGVRCRPFWQHRDRLFLDFLYLSATDMDVNYANPVNDLRQVGTPTGPAAFVDPGYEPGFRVGGAMAISDCSSLAVAVWSFESEERDAIALDPSTGQLLFPVLLDPQTLNVTSESSLAEARYEVEFRMVDLSYERLISHSPSHAVNLILGARYGRLAQELEVNYSILGGTRLETNIDFDGVGPRIGLNGEWIVFNGVFAYGQGTGSFLLGDFQASYSQQNIFAGVQSNTALEEDRIVPLLDLELGLGWQSRNGYVRLTGGYYLSSWFNAMTMPEVIGAVQTRQLHDISDNLTFNGLISRLEFRF